MVIADVDCTEHNDLCLKYGKRISYNKVLNGWRVKLYQWERTYDVISAFVNYIMNKMYDLANKENSCNVKEIKYNGLTHLYAQQKEFHSFYSSSSIWYKSSCYLNLKFVLVGYNWSQIFLICGMPLLSKNIFKMGKSFHCSKYMTTADINHSLTSKKIVKPPVLALRLCYILHCW